MGTISNKEGLYFYIKVGICRAHSKGSLENPYTVIHGNKMLCSLIDQFL